VDFQVRRSALLFFLQVCPFSFFSLPAEIPSLSFPCCCWLFFLGGIELARSGYVITAFRSDRVAPIPNNSPIFPLSTEIIPTECFLSGVLDVARRSIPSCRLLPSLLFLLFPCTFNSSVLKAVTPPVRNPRRTLLPKVPREVLILAFLPYITEVFEVK